MEHLRLYPDPTSHALRQAIAKAEGLSVEEVFVGNGSDEVLGLCFPAFFAGQAQPVQFADITYSFYEVYALSLIHIFCLSTMKHAASSMPLGLHK